MKGDKHAQLFHWNTPRAHHPSSIALQGAIFIPNSVLAWYEYDRQRTDRNTPIIIQHNVIIFVHVIINIIIIYIIMIIINDFSISEGDVMRRLYGDEGKWGHLLLLYPLVYLISELNYKEINQYDSGTEQHQIHMPSLFQFCFSHSWEGRIVCSVNYG